MSDHEDKSTSVASLTPTPTDPTRPTNTAITYGQLLHHGCSYLEAEGVMPQQVKNLASALRGWVQTHGYSLEKVIAQEFGTEFDRFFTRFCDAIAERLAPRTQRDRQEQILRWRRIAGALRQTDTLPESFAGALAHSLRSSPLTKRQVARDCGTTTQTLLIWSNGSSAPRGEAIQVVAKLEAVLEIPKGTLVSRLPLARRTRYARDGVKPNGSTSYSRLRTTQLTMAANYAMKATPRLSAQWLDLLRMKTDLTRKGAFARNSWRVKSIDKTSMRIHPWMLVDGQICATAGVHWGIFASYLGWLKLPAPQGLGLPAEDVDTLVWLSEPTHVIAYAKWMIRRSGQKFHNGVNVFLQLVESYLRAGTGYLWFRPNLRMTAPGLVLMSAASAQGVMSDAQSWRTHCELARSEIGDFRLRTADTMGIRKSRDPKERLAVILNDAFPLKKLVAFVETLERSSPPPAHHRDYCAWIRDVVLCRLLLANPIRIGQYTAMTFREDGTGNLVRVGPGQYRLRFEPADFKNEKGAAKNPYDVEVDSSVSPWIDRYLTEARPHLIDANQTDRFLLPAAAGPRKVKPFLEADGLLDNAGYSGEGLGSRIKYLTSTYIEGCPGFGPQGFRHAIATDHLRRHPGDYLTVAKLLHDELQTVLNAYGHTTVSDGLRVLSSGIREASESLAAMRKAP